MYIEKICFSLRHSFTKDKHYTDSGACCRGKSLGRTVYPDNSYK